MLDCLWLFLPLAYFHGWLTGRTHGVKLGAAGMFDQLFDKGMPKKGCLLYTSPSPRDS